MGIEQGIVLAIVVSLGDRIQRAVRPRDTLLGREVGTDHWIPVDIGRATEQVPGILVYLVYSALWYANAKFLAFRMRSLLAQASEPVHAVIFDADGMSDIDFTGLQTLRELIGELERRGVHIGIARASHLVHHDLKHGALLEQLGGERVFASVEEAVARFSRDVQPPPP